MFGPNREMRMLWQLRKEAVPRAKRAAKERNQRVGAGASKLDPLLKLMNLSSRMLNAALASTAARARLR